MSTKLKYGRPIIPAHIQALLNQKIEDYETFDWMTGPKTPGDLRSYTEWCIYDTFFHNTQLPSHWDAHL